MQGKTLCRGRASFLMQERSSDGRASGLYPGSRRLSPTAPILKVDMFDYYGGKWKKKRRNILRRDGYV